MVFIKLIRRKKGKIICKSLNLKGYGRDGAGVDEIVIASYDHDLSGYSLTIEDFEFLLEKKEREKRGGGKRE